MRTFNFKDSLWVNKDILAKVLFCAPEDYVMHEGRPSNEIHFKKGDLEVAFFVRHGKYTDSQICSYLEKHLPEIGNKLGGHIANYYIDSMSSSYYDSLDTTIEFAYKKSNDYEYVELHVDGRYVNSVSYNDGKVVQQIHDAAIMLQHEFGWDTKYMHKYFIGDFAEMAYRAWERQFLTVDKDKEAAYEYLSRCTAATPDNDWNGCIARNAGYHFYKILCNHDFSHHFAARMATTCQEILQNPDCDEILACCDLAKESDFQEALRDCVNAEVAMEKHGIYKYTIKTSYYVSIESKYQMSRDSVIYARPKEAVHIFKHFKTDLENVIKFELINSNGHIIMSK